jgi:hypothetical protein
MSSGCSRTGCGVSATHVKDWLIKEDNDEQ